MNDLHSRIGHAIGDVAEKLIDNWSHSYFGLEPSLRFTKRMEAANKGPERANNPLRSNNGD